MDVNSWCWSWLHMQTPSHIALGHGGGQQEELGCWGTHRCLVEPCRVARSSLSAFFLWSSPLCTMPVLCPKVSESLHFESGQCKLFIKNPTSTSLTSEGGKSHLLAFACKYSWKKLPGWHFKCVLEEQRAGASDGFLTLLAHGAPRSFSLFLSPSWQRLRSAACIAFISATKFLVLCKKKRGNTLSYSHFWF